MGLTVCFTHQSSRTRYNSVQTKDSDTLYPAQKRGGAKCVRRRSERFLLRGRFFAQPPHAFLKFLPQRCWSIRIEGDEIPQGLRTVPAQPRKRGGVAIRMARDVFAN